MATGMGCAQLHAAAAADSTAVTAKHGTASTASCLVSCNKELRFLLGGSTPGCVVPLMSYASFYMSLPLWVSSPAGIVLLVTTGQVCSTSSCVFIAGASCCCCSSPSHRVPKLQLLQLLVLGTQRAQLPCASLWLEAAAGLGTSTSSCSRGASSSSSSRWQQQQPRRWQQQQQQYPSCEACSSVPIQQAAAVSCCKHAQLRSDSSTVAQ
jgi:hypothetical protein